VLVALVERSNGKMSAMVAGRPVDVDAVRIGAQVSVRVDSQVVDLTTGGKPPDLAVVARGLRTRARVESDRIVTALPVQRALQPKTIRSPMPGRVIRVAVQAGDSVRTGQALVVIEAMKMENEVLATLSGNVLAVHVSPGATVEANADLVTMTRLATATP
jgi:biotin carboxyl carrier protein